jgi:lipopolysaccharide export system permease protein
MPKIWQYLIKHYFKVLSLSVFSFIAILLLTRLDQIARFAALTQMSWSVMTFALSQITYILPIAIPIASLISSILLFQRLSRTNELTALRAAGVSLRRITFPVLLAGAFLTLTNFYISSEVATTSHLRAKRMQHDLLTLDPVTLLQTPQLLKGGGAYVEMSGVNSSTGVIEDLVFSIYNSGQERINLLSAKGFLIDHERFHGDRLSLVSTLPSETERGFDHLIIENQEYVSAPLGDFSGLIQKKRWNLNPDHLTLRLLNARIQETKLRLAEGTSEIPREQLLLQLNEARSEIFRRISLALAAFTFTLLGSTFGVEISRRRSKRGTFLALVLATTFLVCFFLGKNTAHNFQIAAIVYLLPHVLIIFSSVWMLRRISRGIE